MRWGIKINHLMTRSHRMICFNKAFLGSSNIRFKVALSNGERLAKTGNLPNNSGMRPNLRKSVADTFSRIFSVDVLSLTDLKPTVCLFNV